MVRIRMLIFSTLLCGMKALMSTEGARPMTTVRWAEKDASLLMRLRQNVSEISRVRHGYVRSEWPLLFIGVITAAGNVDRREEIRETWFQHPLLQGEDAPIQARFIVGETDSESPDEARLSADQQENGDFVQLTSFQDSYENLPKKSVGYFRWFVQNNKAEFGMKIDDDTFPNLDRIFGILNSKVDNEKLFTYLGNMLVNRRPMDTGKWRQDKSVYSDEFYPKYAAGPGYILRMDLAQYVFMDHYEENSQQLLNNEDTNTGVWVSHAFDAGIPVDYQHLDANEEKCMPNDALAMNLELGVMSCMWGKYLRSEGDFCCSHERRDWQLRAETIAEQNNWIRRNTKSETRHAK